MNSIIVLHIGNSIDYDSRVQKEISSFISLGYRVTLVIWNWEPFSYSNKKVKIIDLNLSNYKFHTNKFSKISRFLKMIKFWYISSKVIKRGNYKYIHCNDLSTLGVVFFLSKGYSKKVIYDAHELHPEYFKASIIKYKIWSFIEKYLVGKISAIIVPEIKRANYLKKKYHLRTSPKIINNFPRYQNVIKQNIKRELKLSSEKKIICYHGYIRKGRGLESIIESLNFLPDNFVLLLIGYSNKLYKEELAILIQNNNLENRVIFYGKVSPDEMLNTISGADLCVALYENNGINNFLCASNSVFDSIMAGVKILTNDYPSHNILKGYKFVGLISKMEPKIIAESVKNLTKNINEIPDSIKHKFSWDSLFKVFQGIYK